METYRWSGKQLKFRAMKKLLLVFTVAVSGFVVSQYDSLLMDFTDSLRLIRTADFFN